MRTWTVLLIIIAPVVTLSLAGIPRALELGILVSAASLWISELIPAGLTGLLIPVMITVAGIAPVEKAFAPFGHHILFLLLGSMLLVRALSETQVDRYLASRVVLHAGRWSAEGMAVALMALAWFIGMWMSNTACAMLLLPVVLGLIKEQGEHLEPGQRATFEVRLLLTLALVPTLGGMLTPFGSLPNAVALSFLERSGQGEAPTLIGWFLGVLPVSSFMMLTVYFLLRARYPLTGMKLKREPLGETAVPLAADGKRVLVVTAIAVLLWVAPALVVTFCPSFKDLAARLPLGVASLVAASLLFVIPRASSTRTEFKGLLPASALSSVDFNLLSLFAGGLALGGMLDSSGIAAAVGHYLTGLGSLFPGGDRLSLLAATVLLSEVGSNTAASSIMVPVALASQPAGASPTGLVMAVAVASGLGAMLPVSTPPNAIVYGTGKVPLWQMIKTGILVDLTGVACVAVWCVVYLS